MIVGVLMVLLGAENSGLNGWYVDKDVSKSIPGLLGVFESV
jgi:methyl coenzyme M reductase alpha subunit